MTGRTRYRAAHHAQQMALGVHHILPGLTAGQRDPEKRKATRRPPAADDFADTCLPDEGYHGSLCDGADR